MSTSCLFISTPEAFRRLRHKDVVADADSFAGRFRETNYLDTVLVAVTLNFIIEFPTSSTRKLQLSNVTTALEDPYQFPSGDRRKLFHRIEECSMPVRLS